MAKDQLTKTDRASSKTAHLSNAREVVIQEVDDTCGRLVYAWITTNDIHKPKSLPYSILGNSPAFLLVCKMHHACRAFRINIKFRGDEIRDRLWLYLRHLKRVTFEGFRRLSISSTSTRAC